MTKAEADLNKSLEDFKANVKLEKEKSVAIYATLETYNRLISHFTVKSTF